MKYGGELTLRRGSLRSGTPKHGTYPMKMKTRKSISFEESSGNIFADLGLKESDELSALVPRGETTS
jgi:hypothetical protein